MVTHHQLRLDLLDGFKRNADNDDNRSTANRYIAQAVRERADNQGKQCDERRGTARRQTQPWPEPW